MGGETRVHAGRIVFGLFIAWVGTIFILEQMGIVELGNIWRFWPVFLIVIGLAKLFQPGRGGIGGAVFFLAIGTAFLLASLDVIDLDWRYLWPGLLVFAGLSMVLRGIRWGAQGPQFLAAVDGASNVTAFAILGGAERRVTSQDFRGGDATAILGGCDIDLTQASITPGTEAVIDCFAMWGGVDIKVPPDWTVEMTGVPLLGGFADTRKASNPTIIAGLGALGARPTPVEAGEKRLRVKGLAIMGGVEVKN